MNIHYMAFIILTYLGVKAMEFIVGSLTGPGAPLSNATAYRILAN